jgi:hypothetical protein
MAEDRHLDQLASVSEHRRLGLLPYISVLSLRTAQLYSESRSGKLSVIAGLTVKFTAGVTVTRLGLQTATNIMSSSRRSLVGLFLLQSDRHHKKEFSLFAIIDGRKFIYRELSRELLL